jgi:hypothetical protein
MKEIIFHLDISATGYDPDEAFVMVAGEAVTMKAHQPVANGTFSYLDFASGTLVTAPTNMSKATSNMVSALDQFQKDANGKYLVKVPYIGSGRLYISFGKSLTAIPIFNSSGPVNGKSNVVIYDKIEFDNAAHKTSKGIAAPNPNVNLTNVDFFGLSYQVTGIDVNTGKTRSIGFNESRAAIEAKFNAITDGTGVVNNPAYFKRLIFKDAHQHLIRILAPKAAGVEDWCSKKSTTVAATQEQSHFWHDYIVNQCYVPNRKFECFSKFWNPQIPGPKYFCEVDATGSTINIFTDSARTVPYTPCPSLPIPINPVVNGVIQPDFKSGFLEYHQVNASPVDWGFVISANTEGSAAPHWASDKVAMSILISICRGCMHMNQATDWIDSNNWYTNVAPVFYYSKLLHESTIDNLAYALSYDDIFGNDPSIYISGHPDVDLTFDKV